MFYVEWNGFLVVWLQWTISELACYTYSLVAVPLYDTLGTEAIIYVIDKGENTAHTLIQTHKHTVILCL